MEISTITGLLRTVRLVALPLPHIKDGNLFGMLAAYKRKAGHKIDKYLAKVIFIGSYGEK
ncbi:MAG: hypothetical protein LBQ00_07705 [Syntrophobacterales bacterium]|jgi:hypothetical protein|nr:hypothetical protein [Syntrophobacterales bacterium]